MQFDSLTAFWQMGGHGAYVWSAYAISVATLLALVIVPLQRSRRIKAELRRGEQRRAARAAVAPAPVSSTPSLKANSSFKEV